MVLMLLLPLLLCQLFRHWLKRPLIRHQLKALLLLLCSHRVLLLLFQHRTRTQKRKIWTTTLLSTLGLMTCLHERIFALC
jgi:predicted Na+-dependent transporter